jgi:general stress protein CsbA
MPPTQIFWLALVATVVLIAASLWTGLRRRRRPHLWLGPLTIVMLVVTIVLTEQLVARYEFPDDTKAVHLPLAKVGGLLALPVVLTGLWLWRSERARRWHKIAVWTWLAAVVAAAVTGVWMFAHGTPRAN